jgi:hypothetical protein
MADKIEINPYNNPLGILDILKDFLENRTDGTVPEFRKDALTTKLYNDTHIVDTVLPVDTGKWETGINRGIRWVIVQQYKDRDQAIIGHEAWVKKLEDNADIDLVDIFAKDLGEETDEFGWNDGRWE